MYTLMQISDLHRSEADPISNDELVSCLLADHERFQRETPTIAKPDAIVITGDLVQGLSLGSSKYPAELETQYNEAIELISKLSDAFVGGDRAKIVLVPGNHDIDWNAARNAMEPVDEDAQDLPERLLLPGSNYRWCWNPPKLFRITDQRQYESRFKYFCKLHYDFYKDARVAFPLDPTRYWNLFSLAEGDIVICAFNSCATNDCFNLCGKIPVEAISQSHLKLLQSSDHLLRISVWHHNVQGPPRKSNYMDVNTIRLMIDKGYRLGLHGHQHKSDVLPCSLHTSEKQMMSIVGVGSLCAGPKDLPQGFNRQYNIIEINDGYRECRVHIREMTVPGIFAPARLTALGGRSYDDLKWTPVSSSPIVNTGLDGGRRNAIMNEIEMLMSSGDYDGAIAKIDEGMDVLDCSQYGRKVLSEALYKGQKWERLAIHVSKPQNADELNKLVQATIALKDWPMGDAVVRAAEASGQFPPMVLQDLRDRLSAERKISP